MDDDIKNRNEKQSRAISKGGDLVQDSVGTKFDYIQAIQSVPLQVQVQNNFDRAMKAFRALVQKDRILSLYKEKQRYEKPSDKKRRKRNESHRKSLEFDNKEFKHKKKDSNQEQIKE
jgi:ribosomal protein S21